MSVLPRDGDSGGASRARGGEALPETIQVFHVSGADDFLVHIAVADVPSLHDFILDAPTVRPEVAHVETHLVFDQRRKPAVEPV